MFPFAQKRQKRQREDQTRDQTRHLPHADGNEVMRNIVEFADSGEVERFTNIDRNARANLSCASACARPGRFS